MFESYEVKDVVRCLDSLNGTEERGIEYFNHSYFVYILATSCLFRVHLKDKCIKSLVLMNGAGLNNFRRYGKVA